MRSSFSLVLTSVPAQRKSLHLFAVLIFSLTTHCLAQNRGENVILATVNGKAISQAKVDASIFAQIFPLQQQLHALRKAALENLVIREVLEQEAKRRGLTIEQLRIEMSAGPVEIAASDVEAGYQENASVFAAMSADEARERLRLDLESQARMSKYRQALATLMAAHKIEKNLEEPRLFTIDVDESPFRGAKEARITVMEYSDFQCPYCRSAQHQLSQVLANYPNDVKLVFKHLPLEIHGEALLSAEAAFCAGKQNQFWVFHDALFASNSLSQNLIYKLAKDLGLQTEEFKNCVTDASSRAAVLRDRDEARRLGITSTPTFVINGRVVRGVISYDNFKSLIDQELQSSKLASRPVDAAPNPPLPQEER